MPRSWPSTLPDRPRWRDLALLLAALLLLAGTNALIETIVR